MKLSDGRETLARVADMVPLTVVAELWRGIGEAAESVGYTDICLCYAGEGAGWIVGKPPGWKPPAEEKTDG